MTTHRSLNKLEFKAHMSIHNKAEVPESETHGARYTRDRFGKNHCVPETGRGARIRRAKKIVGGLLLLLAGSTAVSHADSGRRNTDVRVESGSIDEVLRPKKSEPEERFAFYKDDEKALELNENGDPNMNFRF